MFNLDAIIKPMVLTLYVLCLSLKNFCAIIARGGPLAVLWVVACPCFYLITYFVAHLTLLYMVEASHAQSMSDAIKAYITSPPKQARKITVEGEDDLNHQAKQETEEED